MSVGMQVFQKFGDTDESQISEQSDKGSEIRRHMEQCQISDNCLQPSQVLEQGSIGKEFSFGEQFIAYPKMQTAVTVKMFRNDLFQPGVGSIKDSNTPLSCGMTVFRVLT